MSRLLTLAQNSFFVPADRSNTETECKMIRTLFGMFQDCMIMVAIIMFGMALTLLLGS